MRDWGVMLGGLIIWTLHFLAIYGLASVADVADQATQIFWSTLGLAATGLGLAAVVLIGCWANRRSALVRQLGIGGCVVSGVAIVFQSLPLLVSG